jgi:predicted amidohydrolase
MDLRLEELTSMRLALAQMNSQERERDRNVARAVELVAEAAKLKSDLVLLPEFFNVEYFAQYRDYSYLDYAEPLDGYSLQQIAEAAREHKIWIVATILERDKPGVYYDTAVLFDREGVVRGTYRKTHPAAVFSLEKIYFRYGSLFPVVDVEGWPTSIMICYDMFFPEVARTEALRGAELILAPFAAPKHPIWRELNVIRAFENGCFLAVCNKVGKEGEWLFAGESLVTAPSGEVIAIASSTEDDVVVADLNRELVETWRRRYPMFRDRRPDLYGDLVRATETL